LRRSFFRGGWFDLPQESDAPGSARVLRGGSWNNNADNTRSANRNRNGADNRNNTVGFRPVGRDSSRHVGMNSDPQFKVAPGVPAAVQGASEKRRPPVRLDPSG